MPTGMTAASFHTGSTGKFNSTPFDNQTSLALTLEPGARLVVDSRVIVIAC
jgi:hypothetical protein